MSRLSQPSSPIVLAAVAPTAAGTVPTFDTPDQPGAGFEVILLPEAQAPGSVPRLIDLITTAPADFRLRWQAGGGFGSEVWVTSPGRVRIALICRSIEIYGRARANIQVTGFLSISDGTERTLNAWVAEWAQAAPPTTGALRIPPHCRGLRAASSAGAASTVTIVLRNSYATTVGVVPIASANTAPIGISGAADVLVAGLVAGEIVTLHFDLVM